MPDGYPGLRKHWNSVQLPAEPEVLVPLCGKAIDMVWLEKQNAKVTGVEISEKAILEFMEENRRNYKTGSFADFTLYKTGSITIWRGDFLKLPKLKMPDFDLIYDKAALVALPKPMRSSYYHKLSELCSDKTSILLHHFLYNQDEMPGPPFSIGLDEIKSAFKNTFKTTILEKNELNLANFEKFRLRGLKSGLTEQLLLLS